MPHPASAGAPAVLLKSARRPRALAQREALPASIEALRAWAVCAAQMRALEYFGIAAYGRAGEGWEQVTQVLRMAINH